MTATFTSGLQRRLIGGLLVGVVLSTCMGCQTFKLSEADFQKQQNGKMVDRETGETVEVVGTVGYYGAMIGAAVAEALGK
jgi:hypothetical protein